MSENIPAAWEGGDVGVQVDFEGRENVHRSKPNVVVIQTSLDQLLKEKINKEVHINEQ